MPFIIDRFEDNDQVVLETDAKESLDVPRGHIPSEAKEGDVLVELPEDKRQGEVRYAVDHEQTTARRSEGARLRARIPMLSDEGDLEL